MKKQLTVFLVVFMSLFACLGHGQTVFESKKFASNSAVLVSDSEGKIIYQWQAEKKLIPASVLKILTAQLVIDQWGENHQFHTDFYLENQTLWIKGYGDPFLISEELDRIVSALIERLQDRQIQAIGIDGSYFQNTNIAGRTKVDDPYNAPLSAVAANFNTVYLDKNSKRIRSAESQTPLTSTAIALGKKIASGKHRVNVGDVQTGQQHFAELLAEKLRSKGMGVDKSVILSQQVPNDAQLLYQHKNSHDVNHLLRGALEYSNNFIANQLFMLFGSQPNSSFVDIVLAQKRVTQRLQERYSGLLRWYNFSIEEGAGLSRKNRLSAEQILDVLHVFEPHKALLKSYKNGKVRAKTGTLQGVRTFAGYIDVNTSHGVKTYYFVFLFNDPVPYRFREMLLDELMASLNKV